jgi:basic amino acid/polyamine antiporter, APA family
MSTSAPPAEPREQAVPLKRGINTFLLFFFVVGDILGSGIYAMVGQVAGEVGGAIWMSFGVAVLFALLTAFSYAELVTKYPKAAGASLYVNRAFKNDFLSFIVTFSLMAAGVAALGALARVFGGRYFQEFVAAPELLIAVVFIAILTLINFRGISESVWMNTIMSLIELSGLVIILIIGGMVLFNGQADLARPFAFSGGQPAPLAVLGGATLAFFALIGFENAVNVAEETKDPSKTYPRALFGGLILAGLLYMAVSFTAAMVVPTDVLAGSDGPLLEVVQRGPLPIPPWLFSFIALIAVTNTALVAHIMVSRVLYGMANEGVVPRVLATTHRARQTPWVAILVTTAITLILVGTGDVGRLADTTVLFILIVFLLVHVSLIVLRKDQVAHKHFRAPAFMPYLAIVACLVLLAQQSLDTWLYAGAIALIGAVFYGLNLLARRYFTQRTLGYNEVRDRGV